MRYLILFLIVFIGFVSEVSAQKKKEKFDWKIGKITNLVFKNEVKDYSDGHGPINVSRNDLETATIETNEAFYSISRRLTVFWQKRLKFKENDEVQFAIYKGIFYIKDTKGKSNDFDLVEKIPK